MSFHNNISNPPVVNLNSIEMENYTFLASDVSANIIDDSNEANLDSITSRNSPNYIIF